MITLSTNVCDFIDEAELQQGTDAWHSFRSKGFGASEANVIAGMNPWKSVIDLWAAKTGRPTEPFKMNDAVQHGIDTEPEARRRFTEATDIEMSPICAISKEYEFCRASLDGINPEKDIILEIKCPSRMPIHMKAVRGEIPEYYYPQVQHQLFVTGADLACFWSYMPTMGGFLLEYKPNLPYIEELIGREALLWDCVVNDVEPDPADFPPLIPDSMP
jgi:putative phage-type endonuclease